MSLTEDVQANDLNTYWQLYQLLFYLQRIQANLSIINAAPNVITVTISNTTLFDLALIYYGDATQWPLIANANNLTDPMINGTLTLIIPPNNQVSTGGIL